MTVLLSTDDARYAYDVLAGAGIRGGDAATCLRTATIIAPGPSFREWVASLRGRSPESLAVEYGADAVRAVIALAHAQEVHA